MKILTLTTLAALGLSATVAFAQTPTNFADVDTDANGELSFVELQVAWPDITQAEFDAADTDLSGGLSTDELNSLQPAALTGAPTTEPTMTVTPGTESLSTPTPN